MTRHLLIPEEIHMIENELLRRSIIRNVDSFSPFESTCNTSDRICNAIIQVTFISFAMQNPRRLFTFSLVLKPYKLERRFKEKF